MNISQSQFSQALAHLKDSYKIEEQEQTRGQKLLPKLIFTFSGKYVFVGNVNSFCVACNRDPKCLGSFMAKKLGVPYDISNKHFRLKGRLDTNLLQAAEKKFYEEQVLCGSCGSPETERVLQRVSCMNCAKSVVKSL